MLTLPYIWTLTSGAIVMLKFLTFVLWSCDSLGFVRFSVILWDLYFVALSTKTLVFQIWYFPTCVKFVEMHIILGKWKLVCLLAQPSTATTNLLELSEIFPVINFRSRSRSHDAGLTHRERLVLTGGWHLPLSHIKRIKFTQTKLWSYI